MQDVYSAHQKGDVVVFNHYSFEEGVLVAVWEEGFVVFGGGEEAGGAEADFNVGHVLVGPVGGFEVGRDVGVGCPQQVEEDEEVDGC